MLRARKLEIEQLESRRLLATIRWDFEDPDPLGQWTVVDNRCCQEPEAVPFPWRAEDGFLVGSTNNVAHEDSWLYTPAFRFIAPEDTLDGNTVPTVSFEFFYRPLDRDFTHDVIEARLIDALESEQDINTDIEEGRLFQIRSDNGDNEVLVIEVGDDTDRISGVGNSTFFGGPDDEELDEPEINYDLTYRLRVRARDYDENPSIGDIAFDFIELTSVYGEADLSVTTKNVPVDVPSETDFRFDVSVHNNGPHDAENVEVFTFIPAGVTHVTTSGCDARLGASHSCSLGTVPSGATQDYTITFASNPGVLGERTFLHTLASELDLNATNDNTATTVEIVEPPNTPPTISELQDQLTREDTPTSAIPIVVNDLEEVLSVSDISTASSNTVLVPNANIDLQLAPADGNTTNLVAEITPAANQFGTTTITISAEDSQGAISSQQFLLTVEPVNDAPVNTVPQNQSINDGAPLIFSSANGNVISIDDVDAGQSDIAAVLTVSRGSLDLSTTNGLITAIGNGGSTVVLTGPISAVNASLNGLTYTPPDEFRGEVLLSLETSDNGHSGSGGSKTDSDSLSISIQQANSAPVITSASEVSVTEGSSAVLTITATDQDGDGVNFLVSGGDDVAHFAINSFTGSLVFLTETDFDNPSDLNGDNVYEVSIAALDGQGGFTTQSLTIQVTDAVEDDIPPSVNVVPVNPDPRAAIVDEIMVQFSEPVVGFGIDDLELTHAVDETSDISLDSATLTSNDDMTWVLGNLTELTRDSGIYSLSVRTDDGSIQDRFGNPLATAASDSWIHGAGDINLDRSFDQFDLIRMLQAGLYRRNLPANWTTGDFNRDGVFNQFDVILMQQTQPRHYIQGPFAVRPRNDSD